MRSAASGADFGEKIFELQSPRDLILDGLTLHAQVRDVELRETHAALLHLRQRRRVAEVELVGALGDAEGEGLVAETEVLGGDVTVRKILIPSRTEYGSVTTP